MMKYIKIIVLTTMIFVSRNTYAQQQIMFTQYMFNGLAINPAYAGSHETISMTAMARKQWAGLDGAPSTQTFSIHSPVFNQRIGLGALIIHDKIGVTEQTGMYLSYSYAIPFEGSGKLAFGLQGGLNNYKADYTDISTTDLVFASGNISEWHPNAGFGMYFSTDRFYAGLSVPELIETSYDKNNEESDSKARRHYFVTTGYVFDLNPNLKFKPNLLVKAVDGSPVEFDINGNFLIHDVLWLGLSWRSFDSFDALIEVQITKNLMFGYSYDFATTTELSRVNSGSHELMINYRFSLNKSKIITPRYF